MDKLALFLCSGCGLGEALDFDAIEGVAGENGAKETITHECLCSPEGVAAIQAAIDENGFNGVLIGACSDRNKTKAFNVFDMEKVQTHRICLREQVTWSRRPDDDEEDTQMLAEDLVRMGMARLDKMKLLVPLAEEINDTVMILGGGRTGLEAALTASGLGHPVLLIEKAAELGGRLKAQISIVPEHAPYTSPQANPIGEIIAKVEADDQITVKTATTVSKVTGQPGQFQVTLSDGSEPFTVGAIVQATGSRAYDAKHLEHLGYGASKDVVTANELEEMLVAGKLVCPSSGNAPGRIVFIQCAGSRDENHLRYCSSECCVTTLRQVAEVHNLQPKVECAVIYKDMRAPGHMEHFYLGVQERCAPMMTRGEVEKVEVNGRLAVHLKNSLLGAEAVVEGDLVVLATGMVPTAADGEAIRQLIDARDRAENSESSQVRKDSAELAETLAHHEGTEILNLKYRQGPDLPALVYGFPDSHFICFPYETRRTGVYAAGTVHAPMDAVQAAEDGCGAAMKAVQCIEAAKRGEAVHPRAGDRGYPDFFLQRCTQCKRCTEECPFGTLNEDVKGTPEFNPLRCRRCGICMGACPERIISFPDYSVTGVAAMIKAMEVPEDYEEKPRIVALMCENDAVPALDKAAAAGAKWNPWVRVIPIRCLGSTNIVWIAEALSRGIDGVVLIGCKYGDDYQCHYVRGSELANTRLGNVGETLQRLALEPERIKVVELSHEEFDRIPQIFDDFADELDAMGPNPLKGF